MRLLRLHSKFSKINNFHQGFSLIDTTKSEDLNTQIVRLEHKQSGAMVYNLKSSDKDNTFAPIVKTLPQNDTGCPHILQHLACCGSTNYPVRDPFFNMLRRSVNTYMNAWTGDDFTAYPFSSANQKDFNNLYKVYLDMCLKPLLNQLDFRQQGWRYEISQENNTKQIKGIVFNQMKGAYQNPDRQMYIYTASKLFKNTPFGYDSGGKPESIVKLSYQQVLNMHKYYYHPSNMSFYYYGNSDIKDKLTYLQSQYLHKFNYENKTNAYTNKTNLLLSQMPNKMDEVFHTFKSSAAETPNSAFTYNLGYLKQLNQSDLLCLNMLSYLLLQTNQALLYRQFIEKQLADSFGMGGLNIGSVVTFSVGLKNIKISNQQVLAIFQKCLKQIIEQGVDLKRLEQYTSQSQLSILTPQQTQGINYLSSLTPYMANRLSLSSLVNVRANLYKAVNRLKDKQQLTNLIHKYFLGNLRKIVVRQQPNQNKSQQTSNFVGLQMSEIKIKQQQNQLKQRQQSNSQNSVECLPKLKLQDLSIPLSNQFVIKKQGTLRPTHNPNQNSNKLKDIHVGIPIKGINFIRVIFTLQMQSQQNRNLLKYLDIWRYSVKQGIAVKGLNNKQLSSKLNSITNNFNIRLQKSDKPTNINIIFSASCLDKNVNSYLQLLKKIIYEPEFKKEDISNIFRSYKSEKTEQLLDGKVMQYCLDHCASFLPGNQKAKIFNSYYWVTEGLKIASDGTIPTQFTTIHHKLHNQADVTIIQHSNTYIEDKSQKLGFKLEQNVTSGKQSTERKQNKAQESIREGIQIKVAITNSYDVNFCSQQYKAPKIYSKQYAEISLLVQILEQDYLHKKIRQKGGAYGARAVCRENETIALYSYMDPNSTQTYKAFDQSIKQILSSQVSEQRLTEVKIKYIGGMDSPIIPQNQCLQSIIKNYTTKQKDIFRQYVRSAKWEDIIKTGKKYLGEQVTNKSKVMFGKDVPENFTQQKLKIPKQKQTQSQQGAKKEENSSDK